MALVSDKRGSNDQRTLFNWTRELYPSSKVHYEYALPDGSRIDIFIPVFNTFTWSIKELIMKNTATPAIEISPIRQSKMKIIKIIIKVSRIP